MAYYTNKKLATGAARDARKRYKLDRSWKIVVWYTARVLGGESYWIWCFEKNGIKLHPWFSKKKTVCGFCLTMGTDDVIIQGFGKNPAATIRHATQKSQKIIGDLTKLVETINAP